MGTGKEKKKHKSDAVKEAVDILGEKEREPLEPSGEGPL